MSLNLPIYIQTIPEQADQEAALTALLHAISVKLSKEAGESLKQAVFDRERTSSTYLENGLAIPHGRIAQLDGPLVAVGIHATGIDWPVSENKARLIILLGVPAAMIGGYLQLVQKLLLWYKKSSLIRQTDLAKNTEALRRELEKALL